jgi:class 3 adenylate cyclase
MPIFLDRHKFDGVTAHDIAHLHEKDLELQDRYGVRFMTYWFDAARGAAFCLVDAPNIEAAMRVHREAHGDVAQEIIPVDLAAVEAFLGRISDPQGAADPHAHDSAFRAVMFTDIVDSTGLTQRLGDVRGLEMVRAHDAIVRRNLKTTGGREIKHTGDGIMASFDSIPASVDCARSIQKALDGFRLGSAEPLHVRIGIDAGVPVEESNDLFGATVQAASRLCDAAEPNAILVSEAVRRELGDSATIRALGTKALKGLHKPVTTFQIEW